MKVAPSIIAADFGRLAEAARAAERAGSDLLHVDVMDGMFVPNITVGPGIVRALKKACRLPLDVHLMIEDPDRYVEVFAQAGSRVLTVHVEACRHLDRTLRRIRTLGMRPGVAVNPSTPVSAVGCVVSLVDVVVIMTVNPGFAGQAFLTETLEKVREARMMADREQPRRVEIEVDGGITVETGRLAAEAGADIVVAGASVYGSANLRRVITQLKRLPGPLKITKEVI